MNRRKLFGAIIGAICGAVGLKAASQSAPPAPPPGTFDAYVWAKSFVAHTAWNPSIATDEDTMVAWFASAIMAGYDYRANHPGLSREDIRGALARAYCAPENHSKILDPELLEAATRELEIMLRA